MDRSVEFTWYDPHNDVWYRATIIANYPSGPRWIIEKEERDAMNKQTWLPVEMPHWLPWLLSSVERKG